MTSKIDYVDSQIGDIFGVVDEENYGMQFKVIDLYDDIKSAHIEIVLGNKNFKNGATLPWYPEMPPVVRRLSGGDMPVIKAEDAHDGQIWNEYSQTWVWF